MCTIAKLPLLQDHTQSTVDPTFSASPWTCAVQAQALSKASPPCAEMKLVLSWVQSNLLTLTIMCAPGVLFLMDLIRMTRFEAFPSHEASS